MCKERYDRASYSKNPIDKLVGRCCDSVSIHLIPNKALNSIKKYVWVANIRHWDLHINCVKIRKAK